MTAHNLGSGQRDELRREELRRLADTYKSRDYLTKSDDEMVYRLAAAIPALLDALDAAEAERDALAGQLAAVRALIDEKERRRDAGPFATEIPAILTTDEVRAVLAAPTGETP